MPLTGTYVPSTTEWAREQAEQFEASNGLTANTIGGKPIIVLTTVGAKTGALRKTALMRVEHDGQYAVVASKGGGPAEPHWAENMRRHPQVEVADVGFRGDFVAREVQGEERDVWWERALEVWPDYSVAQAKTNRLLAIFVLDPIA